MRLQFILSEIGVGLRRNALMSVAIVITTAISLFFLGAAMLLRAQVDQLKGFWYDRVEVSIFLCPQGAEDAPSGGCVTGEVTQAQRESIHDELQAMPQVETIFYESQQEAYDRFREQFDDAGWTENITAEALPESYRVKLVDPEQFSVVASAFEGRPGVFEVVDQQAVLERLFGVLNGASFWAAVLAGFILLAAVIMIALTVQLSAFSRRRETGIMRLVGASRFYIQLPFLLEGAIAGLLGSLAAAGILAVLVKQLVIDRLARGPSLTPYINWDEYLVMVPWLVVIGVGLAALASFLTSLRYVKD